MTLKWTPCTVHEVWCEWIKAEAGRQVPNPRDRRLIDEPDFGDRRQNHERASLLWNSGRQVMLARLPVDTEWFRVSDWSTNDLRGLFAIGCEEWIDEADRFRMADVARRVQLNGRAMPELTSSPATWPAPILWGHDPSGPLTIVEGNHRLTALARAHERAASSDMPPAMMVGIGPGHYVFHSPDWPEAFYAQFLKTKKQKQQ